jgi:hypothetical protein
MTGGSLFLNSQNILLLLFLLLFLVLFLGPVFASLGTPSVGDAVVQGRSTRPQEDQDCPQKALPSWGYAASGDSNP